MKYVLTTTLNKKFEVYAHTFDIKSGYMFFEDHRGTPVAAYQVGMIAAVESEKETTK